MAKSKKSDESATTRIAGSQTLLRGLDVIEAVADGPVDLPKIAQRLGLTKSTAYRLATTLVERRYLNFTPRSGYSLGPKLLELGAKTQAQLNLVQVARPLLQTLSAQTLDTVHLGILDAGQALYLDKISGQRRVEISSRVGERHPLISTGLGKALLLDGTSAQWRAAFDAGSAEIRQAEGSFVRWRARMEQYAAAGHAFDLEENEHRIRCVAAPVRNADAEIVAAISLSSARQYMDDERMDRVSEDVRAAAAAIGTELGWAGGDRPAD